MFSSSTRSGKGRDSVKCVFSLPAAASSQVSLLTSAAGVVSSIWAAAGEAAEARQTQVRAATVVGAVVIG